MKTMILVLGIVLTILGFCIFLSIGILNAYNPEKISLLKEEKLTDKSALMGGVGSVLILIGLILH